MHGIIIAINTREHDTVIWRRSVDRKGKKESKKETQLIREIYGFRFYIFNYNKVIRMEDYQANWQFYQNLKHVL